MESILRRKVRSMRGDKKERQKLATAAMLAKNSKTFHVSRYYSSVLEVRMLIRDVKSMSRMFNIGMCGYRGWLWVDLPFTESHQIIAGGERLTSHGLFIDPDGFLMDSQERYRFLIRSFNVKGRSVLRDNLLHQANRGYLYGAPKEGPVKPLRFMLRRCGLKLVRLTSDPTYDRWSVVDVPKQEIFSSAVAAAKQEAL